MAEIHADTVAVITGGAQGIGRAIAEALIADGCRRLVDPADVAVLAAYMLGPQSGVMTGSVVDFDQVVAGAYPE